MNTGLIIFSRFDSKRLPGKALKIIGERSLLGHVLDRTRRVKGEYPIIIATSDRDVDDPIVDFAKKEGVGFFRGDLNDVAGRALACSEHYGFDRFVRICGDRPFLSPELIELLLAEHEKKKLDLATNALENTFPTGLMTEVVLVSSLKKILKKTHEPEDREHVTRYFYKWPNDFRIWNLEANEKGLSKYNLAVDTLADMERAQWLVSNLPSPISSVSIKLILNQMKLWVDENEKN